MGEPALQIEVFAGVIVDEPIQQAEARAGASQENVAKPSSPISARPIHMDASSVSILVFFSFQLYRPHC